MEQRHNNGCGRQYNDRFFKCGYVDDCGYLDISSVSELLLVLHMHAEGVAGFEEKRRFVKPFDEVSYNDENI